MVAIKDMEMPKCCVTYISENDNYIGCPFYKICTQRETIKTNYKPSDCPLVEIEERKVGKWIYHEKSISTAFKELRECSCCHCYFRWEMPRNSYCPNCGAEMVGAENE